MRSKGSREMGREWRTLRIVSDPVLSQWANLCRAPTKKSGRRNRAYGAGFEGAKAKAYATARRSEKRGKAELGGYLPRSRRITSRRTRTATTTSRANMRRSLNWATMKS